MNIGVGFKHWKVQSAYGAHHVHKMPSVRFQTRLVDFWLWGIFNMALEDDG